MLECLFFIMNKEYGVKVVMHLAIP